MNKEDTENAQFDSFFARTLMHDDDSGKLYSNKCCFSLNNICTIVLSDDDFSENDLKEANDLFYAHTASIGDTFGFLLDAIRWTIIRHQSPLSIRLPNATLRVDAVSTCSVYAVN